MNGPIVLAVVAGGLSTVNPCGFALLPAFLGFYAGAREDQLPRAPTRLAQGLVTGLLVAAGFLAVFAAVALPIIYGATQIVQAVPWAGIGLGVAMTMVGFGTLWGWHLRLPVANPLSPGGGRQPKAMLIFGAGYGIASLGCTLPVFLAVVGASLATDGATGGMQVLVAYALGMTAVLVVLATGAALLREGIARGLRRLLPHMDRIAGGMLVLAGAYLTYYWARVQFGSAATLGDDPVVGFVGRFTASIERFAAGNGQLVMAAIGLLGAAIVGVAVRQWRRADPGGSSGDGGDERDRRRGDPRDDGPVPSPTLEGSR